MCNNAAPEREFGDILTYPDHGPGVYEGSVDNKETGTEEDMDEKIKQKSSF